MGFWAFRATTNTLARRGPADRPNKGCGWIRLIKEKSWEEPASLVFFFIFLCYDRDNEGSSVSLFAHCNSPRKTAARHFSAPSVWSLFYRVCSGRMTCSNEVSPWKSQRHRCHGTDTREDLRDRPVPPQAGDRREHQHAGTATLRHTHMHRIRLKSFLVKF